MNEKKIFTCGSSFTHICVTVSAVSADDSWSFNFSSSSESNTDGGDVSITNNNLKIQGLEFIIPDGFKENESARLVGNDTDQNSFPDFKISKVQFDKGNESVIVKVIYGDNKLNSSTYTPSNTSQSGKIHDIDGYISEYDDGVIFDYLKDGKLVEIFAPNKEMIDSLFK